MEGVRGQCDQILKVHSLRKGVILKNFLEKGGGENFAWGDIPLATWKNS